MQRLAWSALALVGIVGCSSTTEAGPPPPCVVDEFEPNESSTKPAMLGTVQDDPLPMQEAGAPSKTLKRSLSTHTPDDVDWLAVEVRDTGFGGNPGLRAMVVGEGFELTAFWKCANGKTKAVACGLGTKVTDDALGAMGCLGIAGSEGVPPQLTMQVECDDTSSDDGTLTLRVRRIAPGEACMRYTVSVDAE